MIQILRSFLRVPLISKFYQSFDNRISNNIWFQFEASDDMILSNRIRFSSVSIFLQNNINCFLVFPFLFFVGEEFSLIYGWICNSNMHQTCLRIADTDYWSVHDRYCLLSYILCIRRFSSRLKKRFPDMQVVFISLKSLSDLLMIFRNW